MSDINEIVPEKDWKKVKIQDYPATPTSKNVPSEYFLNGMSGAIKDLETKTKNLSDDGRSSKVLYERAAAIGTTFTLEDDWRKYKSLIIFGSTSGVSVPIIAPLWGESDNIHLIKGQGSWVNVVSGTQEVQQYFVDLQPENGTNRLTHRGNATLVFKGNNYSWGGNIGNITKIIGIR